MSDEEIPVVITCRIVDQPRTLYPARESVCMECFQAVWISDMMLERFGAAFAPLCQQCAVRIVPEGNPIGRLSEDQRENIAAKLGLSDNEIDEIEEEMTDLIRKGINPFDRRRHKP